MDHHERESLKSEAWERFSKPGATLDEKVNALLMVAQAHFAYSAARSGKHPGFQEFVQHWVWASMPHFGSFRDEQVRDELRRRYPRPRVLKIGAGRSTWGSKPYPL